MFKVHNYEFVILNKTTEYSTFLITPIVILFSEGFTS